MVCVWFSYHSVPFLKGSGNGNRTEVGNFAVFDSDKVFSLYTRIS